MDAISKAMHKDHLGAFSPFGRHLISDGCHYIKMYPGIPALLVCVDDSKFNTFKVGLFKYIDQFDSEQFVKQICNRNLTGNPFAFAWSTDRTYAKLYLKVFRKAVVQMRAEDYNDLLTRGLLDPHHTIGLFAIYLICLNADMGLLQGSRSDRRSSN
jgi:hypothetical protein